jgi:hypothetical protein
MSAGGSGSVQVTCVPLPSTEKWLNLHVYSENRFSQLFGGFGWQHILTKSRKIDHFISVIKITFQLCCWPCVTPISTLHMLTSVYAAEV